MPALAQKAWLLVAVSITLHLVLHHAAKNIGQDTPPQSRLVGLFKRQDPILDATFVLPYDEIYFNASPAAKPFIILGLLTALSFLFSFIGITASDFFCPNLATIAALLGLNESTAGVTFLAFGNGSPDVFSTFAALNGGTFSLAVGELIGAASFIVSVVVGSIALIRPFHVPRYAFLRDTIFFTIAVLLLILVLHDGHLRLIEAGGMVFVYFVYVVVVVVGNWWQRRQRGQKLRRERTMKDSQTLEGIPDPITPRGSPPLRPTTSSHPSMRTIDEDDDDEALTHRANFSLLGAIEFRDVVNSLKAQSRTPSPGASPIAEREDYFSGVLGHSRSISSPVEWPQFSPAAALGASVNVASSVTPAVVDRRRRSRSITALRRKSSLKVMGRRRSQVPEITTRIEPSEPNPWSDQHSQHKPPRLFLDIPAVPNISVTDPEGHQESPQASSAPSPSEYPNQSRFKVRYRSIVILRTLFPSLRSFRHKSIIGMMMAVFSVPAILALTLTLPVVTSEQEGQVALPTDEEEPLDPDVEDGMLSPEIGEELHHLVETPFDPLHSPLGRISHLANLEDDCTDEEVDEAEEIARGGFSKELTAAQSLFGPVFCAALVFNDLDSFPWIMLGATIIGVLGCVLVVIYATDGSSVAWRFIRCMCGFVCSMVWIGAIANEVVSVLLAVGEILGLSNAIIGLTVFAIGNSLADLVANVTVAQFAPTMAYAACFGGPMLNLLLGIGGSGTYGILVNQKHVNIDFSPTLWVSASGLVVVLVATAIFVPLNGYLIDRRWAMCLIGAYAVLMGTNVLVEVKTGRD